MKKTALAVLLVMFAVAIGTAAPAAYRDMRPLLEVMGCDVRSL